MDQQKAREIKTQLADYARELAERSGAPGIEASGVPDDAAHLVRSPTLALGLAPRDDGGYAIAVRYRLGVPAARSIARKVASEAGDTVDVRRTGRIRPLAGPPGRAGGSGRAGGPGAAVRPPVVTALAAGETDRVRPLRPGVSVAHVDVTAGTLGAFVRATTPVEGAPDDAVYALSNWHVLAGSTTARVGDVVVQPGPADGGGAPADRVGTLARVVPLEAGVTQTVDGAIALLDDPDVDPTYPVGRVTTTARAEGGEAVGKIGRTTAVTAGRVTAIELDDVVVGYGDELGALRFDDQIEVESTGTGPFSRGGDSGSLVYREDGVALGLLFAGSETGGSNGTGLTYCNAIDTVLDQLGVTLLP
ncbi:S1 family peptidase [Cellulosimicrobium marinum]|uniref:S1 family peptidase n=1 Tax=Cellulosimicrobium marinum TaxID=1638992 RepID=UPI001E47B825|nr:S1 family peptidase [Cellulosimicrobium marinum]MCB7134994.1 S1 family peptidase [Cellulosimicrobium marinum]